MCGCGSQQLLSLNPTTVIVVLLLGLLLGCDNTSRSKARFILGKGVELERAFFNNSTNLCTEMEKAATEATEVALEALTPPLQNYVNKLSIKVISTHLTRIFQIGLH